MAAKSRSAKSGQSRAKLPKGLRILRGTSSCASAPDRERIERDRAALDNLRRAIEKVRDVKTESLDRTVKI